jgi:hypothetical protein
MRERSEQILRLLCVGLLALVLTEVVIRIHKSNPLARLNIPALPTLAEATNSPSNGKGTNNPQTNAADSHAGSKGTNAASAHGASTNGTNVVTRESGPGGTNTASTQSTRKSDTNSVAGEAPHEGQTNAVAAKHTVEAGTNSAPAVDAQKGGSNSVARLEAFRHGTNVASMLGKSGKGTNHSTRAEMAMAGMGPHGPPGMGQKPPELTLPIQARIDRIVDSELMGPVFHPMPTALMGIAGNVAFLRAPSGETGMVKEGDELGGIKLLRIGINRVLVEEDGKKNELMIYDGLGGQSLESK